MEEDLPEKPPRVSTAGVQQAWQLHEQGLGVRAIARRLGWSPSTISRLLSRERARIEGRAPAPPQARRPVASRRLRGTVTPVQLERLEQRLARVEALLAQLAVALRPAARRGARR